MDEELRRIRFVTRRFAELQGLRMLVIGPSCLVVFWAQPHLRLLRYAGPIPAVAGLVASVLPFVLIAASRPLMDRYYARRFGSVAPGDGLHWRAAADFVAILAALWVEHATSGTGAPSPVLIAGAVVGLVVALRDWPWRPYYLIQAVICGAAAWLTGVVPEFRIDGLTDTLRTSLTVLLVTQMFSGWLDHRLLVKALPRNPDALAELEAEGQADFDAQSLRSSRRD